MTDDQMPDEIWAMRWGDDEPMNGTWVDCCDPTTDNVKYVRADRYAANLITETKALREHCDYLEDELNTRASCPQPVPVVDDVNAALLAAFDKVGKG